MNNNPLNLNGIDFVEFSTNDPAALHQLFLDFGFSKVAKHKDKNIDLYQQGEINFFLNYEEGSFGHSFYKAHGPCISAMGWKVKDSSVSHSEVLKRGAKDAEGDYSMVNAAVPAIYGIGDSLIYLIEADEEDKFSFSSFGFERLQDPVIVEDKGFFLIDHLTNNVYKGSMETWASFYKDVFGFEEVRYFDIKGVKTGLTSYALKSPCGSFCIPINEA